MEENDRNVMDRAGMINETEVDEVDERRTMTNATTKRKIKLIGRPFRYNNRHRDGENER